MKKKRWLWIITFIIVVVSCFSLCACSREEPGPKTVTYGGKTYTIDEDARTISDQIHVYKYEVSGTGSHVDYRFTYPNGATYSWTRTNNVGYGGWSSDYNDDLYVDGHTLMNILDAQMPRESEPKNVPVIILLLVVGIFNTASPQTAWYLSDGWKYKDAEPSDAALEWTRISGIIVIVIAVFMMIA